MYWYGGSFIGMSFVWWFFWVAIVVAFFSLAVPVPRARLRRFDDPLEILRRRYAAGDITTEQYEEQRIHLLPLDAPARTFHPSTDVPFDRRRSERRHVM